MKFTFEELRKFLKTQNSLIEITTKLTNLGFEVEKVTDYSSSLKGLLFAKIINYQPHPGADRLHICEIDIGTQELVQVVCGAVNVRQNLGVAFVPPGVIIPATGQILKEALIRGVKSHGMLCSSDELNLPGGNDGIIEINSLLPTGTSLAEVLRLPTLVEISVTPNRGDCLSVYGIARDLAAAGMGVLLPIQNPQLIEESDDNPLNIINPVPELCPIFSLRLIKDINNYIKSPDLANYFEDLGMRSINPVVDVTNYWCHLIGRPLHAFDAQKIKGVITVRLSKKGELLRALNDQDYRLEEGMLVIADESGVISLAGIIGGRDTAVDDTTKDILLESALFDPINIALTGQKLNLVSEARMRFERGVDPQIVILGLNLASKMIIEYCGGKIFKAIIVDTFAPLPYLIKLNPTQITRCLDIDIDNFTIISLLTNLGCSVELLNNTFHIQPPSWRHDLAIPEDLIEEIARLYGYDNIPFKNLPLQCAQSINKTLTVIRNVLTHAEYNETINFSFVSNQVAQSFCEDALTLMHIANPINEELHTISPSLIPNLLRVASNNDNNNRKNGAIFEIAHQYAQNTTDYQQKVVAGVRFGDNHKRSWHNSQRPIDCFDVKRDILTVIQSLGVSENSIQITADAKSYYHPEQSGTIRQGQKILGYFGKIHPSLCDINLAAFELFYDRLPLYKHKNFNHRFINFPLVVRDFAFVVNNKVTAATILHSIYKASHLISHVNIFDIYQGTNIEKSHKSVAIEVILKSQEKTLQDEEINQACELITANIHKLGGRLRS